jgi:tol-pal system protein YbgF
MMARLDLLERDMRTLQQKAGQTPTVRAGTMSTEGRIAALKADSRSLAQSSSPAIRTEAAGINQRLAEITGEIDSTLNVVDKPTTVAGPAELAYRRSAPPPTAPAATTASTAPTAPAPLTTVTRGPAPAKTPQARAQDQFYEAIRALNNGRTEEAQGMLRDFLARNPGDELAPNAEYWLGESYAASNDYTSAGWVFAESYERNADSALAPHNLLGLGQALAHLDKKPLACATFGKLQEDFPEAADQVQTARQEQRSLGCR